MKVRTDKQYEKPINGYTAIKSHRLLSMNVSVNSLTRVLSFIVSDFCDRNLQ